MAWNNGNYRRNDNREDSYSYNHNHYNKDYRDHNMKFNIGQKCFLNSYPDTIVSIIRLGREQYECRLPNLNTAWFYEHELSAIEE